MSTSHASLERTQPAKVKNPILSPGTAFIVLVVLAGTALINVSTLTDTLEKDLAYCKTQYRNLNAVRNPILGDDEGIAPPTAPERVQTVVSWEKYSPQPLVDLTAEETRLQVYLQTLDDLQPFANFQDVNWDRYMEPMRVYPWAIEVPGPLAEKFAKAEAENPEAQLWKTWMSLANAKDDVHKITTRLRVVASQEVLQKTQALEDGFDDVLDKFLDYYYPRAFYDAYTPIMPARFAALEQAMRADVVLR